MLKQFLSDARKTTAIFTAAALSALPGASFGQDEVVIEPAKHVKAGEGVSAAEAHLNSIDGLALSLQSSQPWAIIVILVYLSGIAQA